MQTSNPQYEKLFLACLLRDPSGYIGFTLEKCGQDTARMIGNTDCAMVYGHILDIFAKDPVCLNAESLLAACDTPLAREVIAISHGTDTINFPEVFDWLAMWSSLRAVDQTQREYAEFRRGNGMTPDRFREFAADMANRIRTEFSFATKRERSASEIHASDTAVPFSTGFKVLDDGLRGGWRIGQIILFAGHKKGGKTVLQANITAWQVSRGLPALVVQLEVGQQMYVNLVLSVLSGIDYDILESKKYDPLQYERVSAALEQMNQWMRLESTLSTVPQIASWVAVKKAEFGDNPGLLVQVDHLNMLHHTGVKYGNDLASGLAMENVVYAIHDMALPEKGIGVPVVLTAQLEDQAGRIMEAKGKLTGEEFKIRSCRAIEHAIDAGYALGRDPKVQSHAVIQKLIDRNGDGSDNYPRSILYNHKTRSFVI